MHDPLTLSVSTQRERTPTSLRRHLLGFGVVLALLSPAPVAAAPEPVSTGLAGDPYTMVVWIGEEDRFEGATLYFLGYGPPSRQRAGGLEVEVPGKPYIFAEAIGTADADARRETGRPTPMGGVRWDEARKAYVTGDAHVLTLWYLEDGVFARAVSTWIETVVVEAAEYETALRQVEVSPAFLKEEIIPAVYETRLREVVVTPASESPTGKDITETVEEEVLVEPERVERIPIPAVYEMQEVRVLVAPPRTREELRTETFLPAPEGVELDRFHPFQSAPVPEGEAVTAPVDDAAAMDAMLDEMEPPPAAPMPAPGK